MPKIETWDNLPAAVKRHLIDRMRERWELFARVSTGSDGASLAIAGRSAAGVGR